MKEYVWYLAPWDDFYVATDAVFILFCHKMLVLYGLQFEEAEIVYLGEL